MKLNLNAPERERAIDRYEHIEINRQIWAY